MVRPSFKILTGVEHLPRIGVCGASHGSFSIPRRHPIIRVVNAKEQSRIVRRYLAMDILIARTPNCLLREEAWMIAWDYLSRSGQIHNPTIANMILAKEFSDLLQGGEINRLRLANKAIAAYERKLAESLIEFA
jgi:hypothetical protein